MAGGRIFHSRSAPTTPDRRGSDRWWWVLTLGLLAGLLLFLFRHV